MAPSRRRLLFALGACATTSLLAACAGIIGLDEFHKGECPGAVCEGGTDRFVPPPPPPPPGDGGDGGGDAGPGTPPVSWAQWPMPNYDAGADVENVPTYTVSGDGLTATDSVTGLTWLLPATGASPNVTLAQADAFCKSQTAEKGGWRLPTRIELVSLLEYGSTTGTLVAQPFAASTGSERHWTSSPERLDKFGNVAPAGMRRYWTVDFSSGDVGLFGETQSIAVKCVKGGP